MSLSSTMLRFICIVGAYVVASIAATFTLALTFVLAGQGSFLNVMALAAMFGIITVLITALLPTLAIIAVAETAELRSPWFYAAAGAAVGAVVGGFSFWDPTASVRSMAFYWLWLAVAGMVGGIVYWRLAGRAARRWT
jgi:hypothetical protein